MPNNPAILDGKKKDVFSNHFKSFSNLGRFYTVQSAGGLEFSYCTL